ncbi:MAG: PAS domain-containing protein [Verrucomicrobiota bacterium]
MSAPDNLDHTLVAAFLEHIPFAVYFKDRDSRIIACSAAHARLHGLPPEQMIGKTDADLFDAPQAAERRADEERVMATGEPMIGKLESSSLPDGSLRWTRTTKVPLRDQAGAIVGTFGISRDITAERRTEDNLEQARKELLLASRQAGMAEVATGVLHNVGNVLNNVTVSAALVADALQASRVVNLAKAGDLLAEHAGDLPAFLTTDPRGRQLPAYLQALAGHLVGERDHLLAEINALRQNIDHIRDIVGMQQTYAMQGGKVETLAPAELMEDALRLNGAALGRHGVQVRREFAPTGPVTVEKVRVLQILVNLIRNAKYAMDEAAPDEKILRVGVAPGDDAGWITLTVADNGIGIAPEHLDKIFVHGFTTRPEGHGFGLHTSALAARQMGGRIEVGSEGRGRGATFTLHLPVSPIA